MSSVALYPSWTTELLLAVCKLRQRERRLEQLKFWLWWEGYWVEPSALRGGLERLARESVTTVQSLRSPRGAKWPAAERAARSTLQTAVRSAAVRLLRFRLRRDPSDAHSAIVFLFLLLSGVDLPWGELTGLEDLEELSVDQILARAVGAQRLVDDVKRQSGDDLHFDVRGAFEQLERIGLLPLDRLPNLISKATDEELDLARDDVKFLGDELPLLVSVLETGLGRDALGLGMVRIQAGRGSGFPERIALLVPFSIGLRRSSDDKTIEDFDLLKRELRKWVPMAQEFMSGRRGGGRGRR